MISQEQLREWLGLARRDDWHTHFVGSDVRQMLAEIERKDAEIAKLHRLLRHADNVVIWEHTTARSGFQEEIEEVLGIGHEQKA